MQSFSGLWRIAIEVALFFFAALQGVASFAGLLDRHRAIKKAELEGGVISQPRYPILPSILGIVAIHSASEAPVLKEQVLRLLSINSEFHPELSLTPVLSLLALVQ